MPSTPAKTKLSIGCSLILLEQLKYSEEIENSVVMQNVVMQKWPFARNKKQSKH